MKQHILFWAILFIQIPLYAQFTDYYSKPNGRISRLTTWGTNTDGSGNSPSTFSASNCRYNFKNRSSFGIDSNFIITGQNSVFVIGKTNSLVLGTLLPGISFLCDSIYLDSATDFTIYGDFNVAKPQFSKYSAVRYVSPNLLQPVYPAVYGKLFLYTLGGSTPYVWPDTYTKKLYGNIQVIDSFYIDCILQCDTFTLTIGESPTQIGKVQYNNSLSLGRVIGKMKRWYPSTTTTGYQGLFPLASPNKKHQFFYVNQSVAPSSGGQITVEYKTAATGNFGLPINDTILGTPVQFNKIDEGYWKVQIDSGLTGASFDIQANPINIGGIAWLDAIRLLHRDSAHHHWQLLGGGYSVGSSSQYPFVGIPFVQNINGHYALATDSLYNYLPVNLVSLKGAINNQEINLNWVTSTEINAKEFVVSMLENNQWIEQKRIPAFGNSQQLRHYHCTLENTTQNKEASLKLCAYDKDGTLSFSKQIYLSSEPSISQISLYPNPFSDQVNLQYFGSNQSTHANVLIYDDKGKTLIKENISIEGNALQTINTAHLPQGIYFIKTTHNNNTQINKFVKL
ncbi:MAG: hypothetical protein RL135_1726 [Bacteroidota bacterium]